MSTKRKAGEGDDNDALIPQKKSRPDAQAQEIGSQTISLQQNLDFSSLNTASTINKRFDTVGYALLHDFHLVVRSGDEEEAFEILELEFYLRKDGCHEDPFTHGSEEQTISGRWYFHRAPRRSTDSTRSSTSLTAYRGGSRKGMDLTIGGPPETIASPYFSQPQPEVTVDRQISIRGGALLRSLRRISDKKVISGPSLLVDEVLRLSKASSIPELVEQKWANDTSAFTTRPTSLFLRPRPSSFQQKPAVYRSPRIGLDLSHPGTTVSPAHPRVVFLSQRYRYFTHPHILTSKGRPQTFLGVLRTVLDTTCADHNLDSVDLLGELVKIVGSSQTQSPLLTSSRLPQCRTR
ncbi:hypothetical protein H0H87_006744 [Tephrocybe sp. NHM501043]|nr:hypothetical protein H0H87_006744 [Tephrocybe sp. NHM501043]